MSFDNWPVTVVLFPCPVLAVLCLLSCYDDIVFCFLSWMYCPDCLLSLSCPGCPTLALAPKLYWRCCPSVAVMSWLVLSVLPRLTCPSCLVVFPSLLPCPICPVLSVLSPLSCPAWFLFQLSCPCSQLTCPRVWSLLTCPGIPSSQSCPAWAVLAVRPTCPDWSVWVILSSVIADVMSQM